MNELRELASDGPIADFVDNPDRLGLSVDVMRGVSLQLDAYWRVSYLRHLPHYSSAFGPWWNGRESDQRAMRTHFAMRFDFGYRPHDWEHYCKTKGLPETAHPVSVVVILREELKFGIPESWPRLVAGHPIYYEHRPEARLFASVTPGSAVSGVTGGTLGGYLWRPSDGTHFAIGCAHVFGEIPAVSAPTVVAGSASIGKVVESRFPAVSAGKCNRRISPQK